MKSYKYPIAPLPIKQKKELLMFILSYVYYPNIILHSDAVQGFSKVDFDYNNVDAFTLSAHKIHGLKGSGALIKRKSIRYEELCCQ